jgi:integrase
VRVLSDPERLRPVVNAIATKLDGTPAAATVVGRKRAVLYNLLDYAIERKQLKVNPLPLLKWTVPKAAHEVDEETVVNAAQARTLLREMSEVRRSGRRLVACFAASYYSGLRPEEAINLRRSNVSIPALVVNTGKAEPPENDWGEFKLRKAAPHAGRSWTDSGLDRDERGLKHRARTAVRRVPIPPDLTRLLRAHLEEFPPDSEGRLFHAERGGPIPAISYQRVWHRARTATFTEDVLASPLAETPYTLRHAAVSTWLAAGIPPTQVAEWAGHSVDVLLKVYAKTLHGHDRLARERWQQALG